MNLSSSSRWVCFKSYDISFEDMSTSCRISKLAQKMYTCSDISLVMCLLIHKQLIKPSFVMQHTFKRKPPLQYNFIQWYVWNFTVFSSSSEWQPTTNRSWYVDIGFHHSHSFRHAPFPLCFTCMVCHFTDTSYQYGPDDDSDMGPSTFTDIKSTTFSEVR